MIDNDDAATHISREHLLPTLSTVKSMLRVLYSSASYRRAEFLNEYHNIEAHIFVRMTEQIASNRPRRQWAHSIMRRQLSREAQMITA
jgi:hypothetical protein